MRRLSFSLITLVLLVVTAVVGCGSPPYVTNSVATNITATEAVLNGWLHGFGDTRDAKVSFVWGKTSGGSYPNETTPQVMNTRAAFSFNLTSLTPDTTYYFKAKAVGAWADYGTEMRFTTKGTEMGFPTKEQVTFPDANLEAAVREAINKPEGSIYTSDLTTLYAQERGISDLTGLEYCVNLWSLILDRNNISHISALAGLTNLQELYLGGNNISDISYLAGLTNLQELHLQSNNISDISPLVENSGLSAGDFVDLSGNPLSTESVNVYIPQLEARGVTVEY